METLDTSRCPSVDHSPSVSEKSQTTEQIKDLLEDLLYSSRDLNVRVWLDGVYTEIDDAKVNGDWINGREVYFKIEGRVDRMKRGVQR